MSSDTNVDKKKPSGTVEPETSKGGLDQEEEEDETES
jgi:hypothetical protein